MEKIGIIGGGASGYFIGSNLKEGKNVTLLEKNKSPLHKVKISGGGRCNLTNACFEPSILVKFYPRGEKELRGVFSRFAPGDTVDWFKERGVDTHTEPDNRIFPMSNNSMSVVNCLRNTTLENGVEERLSSGITNIKKQEDGTFLVSTKQEDWVFDKLVISTGGSKAVWQLIENLGHTIETPIPSLFTFNIEHPMLEGLQGLSFQNVLLKVKDTKVKRMGSLLITHWGLSGPVVLKLSAYNAKDFFELDYKFKLVLDFISFCQGTGLDILMQRKQQFPKQQLQTNNPFGLQKRFWLRVLEYNAIDPEMNYADISKKSLQKIINTLSNLELKVTGKSTNKDEFVTAGGVSLKEVNFKTMESKIVPNLYFAGEVLNIDGITGGFNFQAAWSTGFVVSESLNSNE